VIFLCVAWWCNCYDIELATQKVAGLNPSLVLSSNDLGQVVHTHAFVSKQCNLVAVKGR